MEQGLNPEQFDHHKTFSRLVERIVTREPLSEFGEQRKEFTVDPDSVIGKLAAEITDGSPDAIFVSKTKYFDDLDSDLLPDYQVTFYERVGNNNTIRVEYQLLDGEIYRTADTTQINPNASKLTRYLDSGKLDTSDDDVVRGLIHSLMRDVHDSGLAEITPQEDPENFQKLYTLLNELAWE